LSACSTQQGTGPIDPTLLSDEDVLYCDRQARMATGAASDCLSARAAAHHSSEADTSILHRVIVPAEEQQPDALADRQERRISADQAAFH
jgi:hypothetical protein